MGEEERRREEARRRQEEEEERQQEEERRREEVRRRQEEEEVHRRKDRFSQAHATAADDALISAIEAAEPDSALDMFEELLASVLSEPTTKCQKDTQRDANTD